MKSLASLAVITNAMSSEVVIEKIWELLEGSIYEVGTFESKEIKEYGL